MHHEPSGRQASAIQDDAGSCYVFAYGSLLNAGSARRTLSRFRVDECAPARLEGHVRTFDVAFPNDGSQPDKAYFLPDGSRPATVLLANVRPDPGGASANGVLVPVDAADLRRLMVRERRYALVDVTDRVQPYPGWATSRARVAVFIGRPRFTVPAAASIGIASSAYLAIIEQGVREWDRRCPGFAADYAASTRLPGADRIAPLRRVDLLEDTAGPSAES